MNERQARIDVCEVGRRLYLKGLVAGADGNISMRLPRDRVLTTPSGCSKGFMKPEDMVITDLSGKPMVGGKPSSELLLHLAVYRKRDDVGAVVHAHPPTAVAFTVAGLTLEQCVMPEVLLYIGMVPTTRYATPSSPEGPEVIEELIGEHDALLLDRHGAVTVGTDVFAAWERMEKLEHFAEVVMRARQLGSVRVLSADELTRLEAAAGKLGYQVNVSVCENAPARKSAPAESETAGEVDTDAIADIVAKELKERGVAAASETVAQP